MGSPPGPRGDPWRAPGTDPWASFPRQAARQGRLHVNGQLRFGTIGAPLRRRPHRTRQSASLVSPHMMCGSDGLFYTDGLWKPKGSDASGEFTTIALDPWIALASMASTASPIAGATIVDTGIPSEEPDGESHANDILPPILQLIRCMVKV